MDSNWSPRITPKQAYKFAAVTSDEVAVSFSVATNKETIVQPSKSKTMDLTEEKVSFDQMPTVVSELKQEMKSEVSRPWYTHSLTQQAQRPKTRG